MNKLMVFIGLIGFVVITGLFLSLPIYFLWNACLVPAIDGVREISWLQAWGLLVLFRGFTEVKVTTKNA